jgi:alpha-L-arabinofuranosidase
VNRHLTNAVSGDVRISGFTPSTSRGQQLSADLYAVNDDANPDAVVPKPVSIRLEGNRFQYSFPPRSVTVLELQH